MVLLLSSCDWRNIRAGKVSGRIDETNKLLEKQIQQNDSVLKQLKIITIKVNELERITK